MKMQRKSIVLIIFVLANIILIGNAFAFPANFQAFMAPSLLSIGAGLGFVLFRSSKQLFAYFSAFALTGFLFFLQTKFQGQSAQFIGYFRFVIIGFLLSQSYKSKKLSYWIFTAMLLGIEVGIDFPAFAGEMKRFSDIFLRLIKTLVAPLIFSTLVVGIAGHSNLKQVGRIGLKSILYFEIVTTFALFIGLLAINITQAGKGLPTMEVQTSAKEKSAELLAQLEKPKDHLVEIFPENIAKSIVENQVLQIVIFSVLFAIAISLLKNVKHKETMLHWSESLSEVMFKFTDIVMFVAPLAVFGAIASTVSKSGVDVLLNLMKLVGTLYVSLVVFVLVILLPIALFFKIPIKKFLGAITEPLSIAFATASSEAALPKALENMEKFGVPKKIVGFVIPTGYSFNLDGTTLYLSMATVFVAQMCGVELTIGQQIAICLTLMLTSKGVAGVRGASFVILTTTLMDYKHLGLDVEKAGIILGVDALMDMGRTSVNVLGNCLASAVVARSEKELFVTENGLDDELIAENGLLGD